MQAAEQMQVARKEAVKGLIRALHDGADPQELKGRFRQVLHGLTAADIAQIEQELIEEGMPREEVHRLCDVHLSILRESLEGQEELAPPGHPINILMGEHRLMLEQAQRLRELAQCGEARPTTPEFADIIEKLRSSESHYVREENVLFPYLEKHGITQPPAIMWMEHDQIRAIKKGIYALVEGAAPGGAGDLASLATSLAEALASHFYKENNVLFPAALRVITAEEWPAIREEFDALGYCSFTPERQPMPGTAPEAPGAITSEGTIRLPTGTLSVAELQGILNALPLDVTFVDKDDRVRYFNDIAHRIFPRAKAVLGRTVQRCHPQKSLAAVNEILQSFREGRRDVAEFWLQHEGRFIHIRYFPVRDRQGNYLGCLEVMQDVTAIRQLEGEKRLL
jgi:PAS domain S-box-containing protein